MELRSSERIQARRSSTRENGPTIMPKVTCSKKKKPPLKATVKKVKSKPQLKPERRSYRSVPNQSQNVPLSPLPPPGLQQRTTRSAALNSKLKEAFTNLVEKRKKRSSKVTNKTSTNLSLITSRPKSKSITSALSKSEENIEIAQDEEEQDYERMDWETQIYEIQDDEANDDNVETNEDLIGSAGAENETNIKSHNISCFDDFDNNLIQENFTVDSEKSFDDNFTTVEEVEEFSVLEIKGSDSNINSQNNSQVKENKNERDSQSTTIATTTSPYTNVCTVVSNGSNLELDDETLNANNYDETSFFVPHDIDIQIEQFIYCECCNSNFINLENYQEHKLNKCPENDFETIQVIQDPLQIFEDEFPLTYYYEEEEDITNKDDNNNNNNSTSKDDSIKNLFAATAFKYYTIASTPALNGETYNALDCDQTPLSLSPYSTISLSQFSPTSINQEQALNAASSFINVTSIPSFTNNIVVGDSRPLTTKILVPLKDLVGRLSTKSYSICPVEGKPTANIIRLNGGPNATREFLGSMMTFATPQQNDDNYPASSMSASLSTLSLSSVKRGQRKRKSKLPIKPGCDNKNSITYYAAESLNLDHTYGSNSKQLKKGPKTKPKKRVGKETAESIRRNEQRENFESLYNTLQPTFYMQKNSSKITILKKAKECIKMLQVFDKDLIEEKEFLTQRNQLLWMRVKSLSQQVPVQNEVQSVMPV